MKRIPVLFCVLLLLVSLLSGCVVRPETNTSDPDNSVASGGSTVTDSGNTETEKPGLAELQKKFAQSNGVVAVAFIGYIDSESSEVDIRAYVQESKTGKAYPFLRDLPLYMAEGQELYAIVPIPSVGELTLYSAYRTDSGELAHDPDHPLAQGGPGEALLLRCNPSEIFSNVRIAASDGGGAILFSPELSMENGHLAQIVGVYDFSVYEEMPDEHSVEAAMELFRENEKIKAFLQQGMKLMYTGDKQLVNGRTCLLFALGTDHDGHFVREQLYGVCDNLIYVYDVVNNTWSVLDLE